MPEPKHLSNPPIREAIVEFGVEPAPGVDFDSLSAVAQRMSNEYPSHERIQSFEGTIKIEAKTRTVEQTARVAEPRGYLLKSEDGARIVRVEANRFSFSWLTLYPGWDEFFAAAMGSWGCYRELLKPMQVDRLAARYINRMILSDELPVQLGDYLELPPQSTAGTRMESFLTQLHVCDDGDRALRASIIQASEHERRLVVILDIDTSKIVKCECGSAEIPEVFRDLRDFKNRLFFRSITPKTVRMYE